MSLRGEVTEGGRSWSHQKVTFFAVAKTAAAWLDDRVLDYDAGDAGEAAGGADDLGACGDGEELGDRVFLALGGLGGDEADVRHAHDVGRGAHAAGLEGRERVEADRLVGEVLAGVGAAHPGAGEVHGGLAGGHELLGVAVGLAERGGAEVAGLDPLLVELGGLDEGRRRRRRPCGWRRCTKAVVPPKRSVRYI